MELIRNIATVIGCVTGVIGFVTMLCKPVRKWIIESIQRISGKSKVENQLSEIKGMIEAQSEEQRDFRERVENSINIALEFTEAQCRRCLLYTSDIRFFTNQRQLFRKSVA